MPDIDLDNDDASADRSGVTLQPEEIEKRFNEINTPENLGKLAKHLRSFEIKKTREGIFDSARVDYVKGNYFIETLMYAHESSKWPKNLPAIECDELAKLVASVLVDAKDSNGRPKYFLRAKKDTCCSTKTLTSLAPVQRADGISGFDKKTYFVWVFEASMTWSKVGIAAIIIAFIGFQLMPLWPLAMKKGVWWMSVTFLILMSSFVAIRLVAFLFFWTFGIEFWILPNFFDDSLAFSDCFKPSYVFKKTDGNRVFRIVLIGIFGYIAYWGLTDKQGVDDLIKNTIQLKDDLYAGNITINTAALMVDDRGKKKTPSVSDLLKDTELNAEEGAGKSGSEKDNGEEEGEGGGMEEIVDVDINMDSKKDSDLVSNNKKEEVIVDENILGDDLLSDLDKEL